MSKTLIAIPTDIDNTINIKRLLITIVNSINYIDKEIKLIKKDISIIKYRVNKL